MKLAEKWTAVLLLGGIMLLLAACGGGGGGGATTTNPGPATYSISGNVTVGGIATSGVTVTLSGTATATATTDNSGHYTFSGLANGSYTLMPSQAGVLFTPSQLAESVNGANITAQNFAGTVSSATTYSISGSTGVIGTTVTVTTAASGTVATATSSTGGAYSVGSLPAATYTVTPTLSGYTFSPASSSVSVTTANVTGVNFTPTVVPVPHSISGTVTGVGGAAVTITVTGGPSGFTPVTTTTNSSGAYTVSGLLDGTYTLTPSLTGYTFSPVSTSVTLSGANATATTFAGTANASVQATVNGTVSGDWVEGVTITVSGGGASGSTTTNASGQYSFTLASGQSYTFTPSLSGYTFSGPATATITAGSSSPVTATGITATSAIASDTITGTLSYAGSKTGPVYVRLSYAGCGGGCPEGTVVNLTGSPGSYSGSYTLRGIPNNSYGGNVTITAEMDTLGNGQPNASNPSGSWSSASPITASPTTAGAITLTDPAAPTLSAPVWNGVVGGNTSAIAFFQSPNTNGVELATGYTVSWGTDTAATNGGTLSIPAEGANNGGAAFVEGLTDGSAYYFKVTATASGSTSATSTIYGPVTIGAATGSYTISGTITSPSTPTGPMFVAIGQNNGGGPIAFTYIASPSASQSYTLAGVPNGTYSVYAIADNNNDQTIDAGDFGNTNGNIAPSVTVSGANATANVTLPTSSSATSVGTNYSAQYSNYALLFNALNNIKRVESVILYSGPNVAVPYDMGDSFGTGNQAWVGLPGTPIVGDAYGLKVCYSDSTCELKSVSVTGVYGPSNAPTSLTTSTNGTTYPGASASTPEFIWAAPSTALNGTFTYSINVSPSGGGNWWDGNMPSSQLSVLYNANGMANPSTLTAGGNTWFITAVDSNGNQCQSVNGSY